MSRQRKYRVLWESADHCLRVVHVPTLGGVLLKRDWHSDKWVLDIGSYSMVQVADMIADAVKQARSHD